ncbi:MAG: SDR family NAD(P)-dependent oxidoreductase [Actinomycetota bacterium]
MLNRLLDTAIEATVVGSFTRIGPAVRSRLDGWEPVDVDLTDTAILVTGGSSGLGRETARRLVGLGATVHLTSRSATRARGVAEELNDGGPGTAIGHALDTGELDSVDELVGAVTEQLDGAGLDVLLHNAGALTDRHETNSAGLEQTLASHLVGPYALTLGLRPHLSPGARVLWMSSGGMYTQGLDVDRLEMRPERYQGSVAYARAKRAQVELVTHLAPRLAPDVILHALHPGWVDTPGVDSSLPGFGRVMGPLLRDVEDGADTAVWLAAGGASGWKPGLFWLDRRPRSTAYLPGTSTTESERGRLVEWLDARVGSERVSS